MAVTIVHGDVVNQQRVIQAFVIGVLSRNHAVEAVPILAAKMRLDGFRDVDGSVFACDYFLIEMLNDELTKGGEGGSRNAKYSEANCEKSNRFAGEFHFGGSGARRWVVALTHLAFGPSRSGGVLISKNSRGLKLNMPAM